MLNTPQPAGRTPAAVAAHVPPQPEPSRHRTINMIIQAVLASLTLMPTAAHLPAPTPRTGTTPTTIPAPQLAQTVVADASRTPRAPTTTRDHEECPRVTHTERIFPVPYLGEVYAQLSANPTSTVQTTISIAWGPWRWQRLVSVRPGMVQFGQGGTLLLFTKLRGTDGNNPRVKLDSTVPVCVVLRTAEEDVPHPRTIIDANAGWTYHQ